MKFSPPKPQDANPCYESAAVYYINRSRHAGMDGAGAGAELLRGLAAPGAAGASYTRWVNLHQSAEPTASEEKSEGAVRFSVSLPAPLARALDEMTEQKSYKNRSLAIGDMIRAHLVEHRQSLGGQIAGTITVLYDHHKPHLQALLTDLQHDHTEIIVSTLHVHLDHDNCLEVMVVRGDAPKVRALADRLIAAKGVKHGRLTVTATGEDLPI